jgi:hypothetical protein
VHDITSDPNFSSETSTKKRPFSATLLTWVVLILASLGWLRFSAAIRQWSFFNSLNPAPPLFYLAITGFIWGLIGVILVWGLFLGRSWAPQLARGSAIAYATVYWMDRLFIADKSALISRWPFAFGLTVLLIGYTFWVLSRQKVQQYYQKRDFDSI